MASGPSKQQEAEWQIHGSIFNSVEKPSGGYLSVSYTDTVDTRWADFIMLGPLITTIDCAAAAGTAANVSGFALSGTMNATTFLYAIRGTKWAKIKVSDMTLVSDGTETALSEAATDVIYTKSADGTQIISFGMNGTAYENITTVGNGATDTHSAHNGGTLVRTFVQGGGTGDEPVIYGAVGQTLRQAILSGSSDMDDVTWTDIAVAAEAITPTSLAFDGNALLWGTNEGPLYLQEDARKYKFLIPEIGADAFNCKAMKAYSFGGVIVPLTQGTRIVKNVVSGRSIGPEVFSMNQSPVTGRLTAFTATLRWGYGTICNPTTDRTYLVAMRPAGNDDNWHGNPWSYWTIGTLGAGLECGDMEFIDTAGGARTNPTIVGGSDDDVWWATLGRIEKEYDDSNYRFASSGTWYGTEMRRYPRYRKRISEVIVETSNCSATQTVQLKWAVDGGSAVDFGAPITSDGFHRVKPVTARMAPTGVRLQPQITLTTASSSASPRVIGSLTVKYELLPLIINGQAFEDEPR